MNEAENIWLSKTDVQLSEAAAHLTDYTVDGENIIRAELTRRGLPAPSPANRAIQAKETSLTKRYSDAYGVASAVIGLGTTIKVVGGAIASLIFLGALGLSRGPFGSGAAVLGGLMIAAVVGGFFFVCGVIVSAQGQVLLASLDAAVASSPFLTNSERASVMGLPPDTVARCLLDDWGNCKRCIA